MKTHFWHPSHKTKTVISWATSVGQHIALAGHGGISFFHGSSSTHRKISSRHQRGLVVLWGIKEVVIHNREREGGEKLLRHNSLIEAHLAPSFKIHTHIPTTKKPQVLKYAPLETRGRSRRDWRREGRDEKPRRRLRGGGGRGGGRTRENVTILPRLRSAGLGTAGTWLPALARHPAPPGETPSF